MLTPLNWEDVSFNQDDFDIFWSGNYPPHSQSGALFRRSCTCNGSNCLSHLTDLYCGTFLTWGVTYVLSISLPQWVFSMILEIFQNCHIILVENLRNKLRDPSRWLSWLQSFTSLPGLQMHIKTVERETSLSSYWKSTCLDMAKLLVKSQKGPPSKHHVVINLMPGAFRSSSRSRDDNPPWFSVKKRSSTSSDMFF